MRRKKFLTGILLVAIVVACLSLVRIRTVTVPAWRLQVLDTGGNPISNATVRQSWINYSVERKSHEQTVTSDSDGYAYFPERSVAASVTTRVLVPLLNLAQQAAHASFGRHSNVVVVSGGLEGWAAYEPDHARPETVIIRPRVIQNNDR